MNRIKGMVSVVTLVVLSHSSNVFSQRNFYHRLDVGSSNIYTFVGSNLITGYANYLSHDMLFDNSFSYSIISADYQGQKIDTKTYNMMGLAARELLNDAFAGVKLGYQSDNMGSFNWGVYASAHFKINQFKAKFPSLGDFSRENVQYLKPGVGVFLTFGSVESQTKIQMEAAVRYDTPLGYKGFYGNEVKALNDGVSSHFAVKVAGYSWASVGVYADINHYDLYKQLKEDGSKSKFKMYNLGVTFTITPKRGEDLYGR